MVRTRRGARMLLPLVPLSPWAQAVRLAAEPCFVLDAGGRVAALSESAASVLGVDARTVGVPLLELLTVVDVTVDGIPLPDAASQAPPLRTLRTGQLTRGLVRMRSADGLVTYDVVSVPLGGQGVLTHLHLV